MLVDNKSNINSMEKKKNALERFVKNEKIFACKKM